jgi:hypothetical protein
MSEIVHIYNRYAKWCINKGLRRMRDVGRKRKGIKPTIKTNAALR